MTPTGCGEAAPGKARARGDVQTQPQAGGIVRGVHVSIVDQGGAAGRQLHGHDEHSHAAQEG